MELPEVLEGDRIERGGEVAYPTICTYPTTLTYHQLNPYLLHPTVQYYAVRIIATHRKLGSTNNITTYLASNLIHPKDVLGVSSVSSYPYIYK